jgi:hypothetical protein
MTGKVDSQNHWRNSGFLLSGVLAAAGIVLFFSRGGG